MAMSFAAGTHRAGSAGRTIETAGFVSRLLLANQIARDDHAQRRDDDAHQYINSFHLYFLLQLLFGCASAI